MEVKIYYNLTNWPFHTLYNETKRCTAHVNLKCQHVVWAGKYRCGKENTGMESKCDSLFPSVPAT
jgi:hypothetical protein